MHDLHATYNSFLVASSYAISVFGSYVALQFAIRIPRSKGKAALSWLAGAAVALGGGAIWAMHFLAMLAYQLPIAVSYDGPLTLASLLAAIGVTGIGLWLVGNGQLTPLKLIGGGTFTGLGVAAMHYTGMAAMQMQAELHYDPPLVGLSLVIAIVASIVALWLAFHLRSNWQRVGAAFVMGVAVFGMHYTGMAAATLIPSGLPLSPAPWSLQGEDLGLYVFLCSFAVLSLLALQLLVDNGQGQSRTKGLPLKTKASVGTLFFLLLVFTVAGVGYRNMGTIKEDLEANKARLTILQATTLADVTQQAIRSTILTVVAPREASRVAPQQGVQLQLAEDTAKLQAALEAIQYPSAQQQIRTALTDLRATAAAYSTMAQEIVALVTGNQGVKAPLSLSQFHERGQQLSQQVAQLATLMHGEIDATKDLAEHTVARTQQTFLGLLVLGPVFAILIMVLIVRSISQPLNEMTAVAQRLAAGDIDQQIQYQGQDESGILADAFRELIAYINRLAEAVESISKGDLTVSLSPYSERDVLSHRFLRMVHNLSVMNSQMQKSAEVLTAATGQIMASTSHLTASVSDTATAVTQTAATVEEVKQTAYISGTKAQEVADSAHQTAQISQAGVQAAEAARLGLTQVQQHIELIAHSVVKLGEQSQAIGDIIDTVNEVAEQSNLLAVNAAIEAAKAGEHGKGFAVVAQEVRRLAEQSKGATGQVRAILHDIQKAAHRAVLVTEQGTKAIEGGVQQSLAAGESIQALMQRITEVAHAVTQIATSSQQQLVGMDQAAAAIVSIKQGSTQNAEGMQHIAHAAQNLHQVGQTLKGLVEQYRLTAPNGSPLEDNNRVDEPLTQRGSLRSLVQDRFWGNVVSCVACDILQSLSGS